MRILRGNVDEGTALAQGGIGDSAGHVAVEVRVKKKAVREHTRTSFSLKRNDTSVEQNAQETAHPLKRNDTMPFEHTHIQERDIR